MADGYGLNLLRTVVVGKERFEQASGIFLKASFQTGSLPTTTVRSRLRP